ncbi:MAG: hypothetical protein ACK4TA_23995 [Saprospiraceae bacterium]
MRYLIGLLTCIIIALGCQSKDKPGGTTATTTAYPPISQEVLETIVTKGDHIDIVFYKYPISVSRDGNSDVVQELARLTAEAPATLGNCQPDGRIFYNGNGETLLEADLYIQPNCYFVVFMQNGKPAFANTLTNEAIQFYDGLTKQFRQ